MSANSNDFDLSFMAKSWPSGVVARKKISDFSGGIMSPGYIANLDSQGKGPNGRIRVGRQTAYEVTALIEWLESRTSVLK